MDSRGAGVALGLARSLIGVAFVVAPGRAVAAWSGREADATSRITARGLGGRDLAIGVGTLWAASSGAPLAPWLWAGACSDAADALGVLGSWRALRPVRRALFLTSASAATVLGARHASR